MWRRKQCTEVFKTVFELGFYSKRWMSTAPKEKRFAALWGNGDFGRLGLGVLESQWSPSVCTALENQSVRSISCGGAHTLFLTETGRVYATGLNDFGQLGISEDKSYSLEPLEVSGIPKEIIQISAGYHHSSAVTVDGELYMWGNNSSGQLGLGKNAANIVPTPSRIDCLNGIRITKTALGSEHSIAITDQWEALSWGSGRSGRLGHGHQSGILGFLRSSSEFTPRLIKSLEGIKVRTVSAGFLHSACINENGSVYIFGEKTTDKLGFGEAKNATSPSIMGRLPNCLDISCGGYHTCVLTGGGELYTWGSNENGCLGIGCIEVSHVPQRVKGPFLKLPVYKKQVKVKVLGAYIFSKYVMQISCGWKHTAAISDGKVFTWGWGGSHGTFSVDGYSSGGQLGHGNDMDYFEPMMVSFDKNIKVLEVSCGFNHTGAILEYA